MVKPRMDTNGQPDLRNPPNSRLLFREDVFGIVGSAMEVLSELGHGLHEKPYENALVIEFGLRKMPYARQNRFDVLYKQVRVGGYIPDLIVFDAVIVDTKVIPRIADLERGKMLNYLKITGLRVGLILNFSKPTLDWERIVR